MGGSHHSGGSLMAYQPERTRRRTWPSAPNDGRFQTRSQFRYSAAMVVARSLSLGHARQPGWRSIRWWVVEPLLDGSSTDHLLPAPWMRPQP